MISIHKAPVDEQDMPIIVKYLSEHFGETNPIEQLPVNVNTAPVEVLARLPGISRDVAQAIVECRQATGPFDSVEELSRIKGLGGALLERIKPYIKTSDLQEQPEGSGKR